MVLWLLARSRWVDKSMHRLMQRALDRSGAIQALDYARLLDLRGDYVVSTYRIGADDWMAGCTLAQLELFEEGVSVLGIHRPNGNYIGVPRGESKVDEGDLIVLYGSNEDIDELRRRRRGARGDQEHEQAKAQQRGRRQEQARNDVDTAAISSE